MHESLLQFPTKSSDVPQALTIDGSTMHALYNSEVKADANEGTFVP